MNYTAILYNKIKLTWLFHWSEYNKLNLQFTGVVPKIGQLGYLADKFPEKKSANLGTTPCISNQSAI